MKVKYCKSSLATLRATEKIVKRSVKNIPGRYYELVDLEVAVREQEPVNGQMIISEVTVHGRFLFQETFFKFCAGFTMARYPGVYGHWLCRNSHSFFNVTIEGKVVGVAYKLVGDALKCISTIEEIEKLKSKIQEAIEEASRDITAKEFPV